MSNNLPPRPNLDHLRRQAKSLLAAIAAGEADAVATLVNHLPAARGMSTKEVAAAKFRLADAQSALARQTGFAGWPQLARHVEQLRSLEGTWEFDRLEIDGRTLPVSAISSSRVLIDGDRFRTESPEAVYEGVFNIDVEADPHGIDIEFVAGPEAGNTNRGVFRLADDRLEICLDMTGNSRPAAFRTAPGSGCALENLRRASNARPASVSGGTPPSTPVGSPPPQSAPFAYIPSPTLTRLQGEWMAVEVIRDGQTLPPHMLAGGRRIAKGHEVKISFGGHVVIHALVRLHEHFEPAQIDYQLLDGPAKGQVQLGIMRWNGPSACFCMGAPGQDRPSDFASPPGSGRTLSTWRPQG